MAFWDVLPTLIRAIRINDVIDIAVMAYILYRVLIFLSRTGSGRALRGMLLVVLAIIIGNKLELYVINFIFGKTLELGVLVLLIIFQPEVRSLLEKVGAITRLIPGGERSKNMGSCIDEVVKSCEILSKTKTGALIVFERDNVLDQEIQTGDRIDVETRAILLQHIFDKNTILHDGAVIIRNERIFAARCRLPLSNNAYLPQRYGMRHRAGLGMSEHSDAVVVIVSEQTGDISVAADGQIMAHLATDTLRRKLERELLRESEQKLPKPGSWVGSIKEVWSAWLRRSAAEDKEDEDTQADHRQ